MSAIHSSGSSRTEMIQYWLNIQCQMIRGVDHCSLFEVSPDLESANVIGYWPDGASGHVELLDQVIRVAASGAVEFEELIHDALPKSALRLCQRIAVLEADQSRLVIVLDMERRTGEERRAVVKLLQWNSAFLRFTGGDGNSLAEQETADVLSILTKCMDQHEFRTTAMTLVTELVARFGFQRVSLGLRSGMHMEVLALSHSAGFKQESNLLQAIGAAMDEAVDQDRVVIYPPSPSADGAITQAHEWLSRQSQHGSICTIPLCTGDVAIGAITLEHLAGQAQDPAEVCAIEQLAALVAPVVWLRHREKRKLRQIAWHRARDSIGRLIGPDHIGLKLFAASALLLVVFLTFAQTTWRISADAVVEGSVQRTVAAPLDGFIAEAYFRAGDIVTSGEKLGSLDDSDLRLRRLKWSTLRQQMLGESREARAQYDRAEVAILDAKIAQAEAELELIDEQLSRTLLTAPFDGVIIEGDLSQKLGTPVSRGDMLFRISPLDDFRIVLRVDERDVALIEAGQPGSLVLTSMPSRINPLTVAKITPVSTAEGGRNYFRVEARLEDAGLPLQAGMEGVAKVDVGEANLFWVWTREMFNWIRLQTWTWWR